MKLARNPNGKFQRRPNGKFVVGCCCGGGVDPYKCFVCKHEVPGRGCGFDKNSIAVLTYYLPILYSDTGGTTATYSRTVNCYYAGVFTGNPQWRGILPSTASESSSSSSSGGHVKETVVVERWCRAGGNDGDNFEWRIQIQTESLRAPGQTCVINVRMSWPREAGAHCDGINTDEMFNAFAYVDPPGRWEQGLFGVYGQDLGIYSGGFGSTEIAAPMGFIALSGEPYASVQIINNTCPSKQLCGDHNNTTLCDSITVDGVESGLINGNGITTQNTVLPRDGWHTFQKYNPLDVFYSTGAPVDENGYNYYLPYSVSALDLGKASYDGDCNWYLTATNFNRYPSPGWSITWRSPTEEVGGTYVPWVAVASGLSSGPWGYGWYTRYKYFPAYIDFNNFGYFSNLDADAGTVDVICGTLISSYDPIHSPSSNSGTSSSQTYESNSSKSSVSSLSSPSSSPIGSESSVGDSSGGGGGVGGTSVSESSVTDGQTDGSNGEDTNVSTDPEWSTDNGSNSEQSGSFATCCNYFRADISGLTGYSAGLNNRHSLRHYGPDDSQWRSFVDPGYSIVMRSPACVENVTGKWEIVLTDIANSCTVVWINESIALCPPATGWVLHFSSCGVGTPAVVLKPCTQAEWSSSSSSSPSSVSSVSEISDDCIHDWDCGLFNAETLADGYASECKIKCCTGILELGETGSFTYEGVTWYYTRTNEFLSGDQCRKYIMETVSYSSEGGLQGE